MLHSHITDKFPTLEKEPVTASIYCDQSFYEREKAAIFRRCWMMAGRVEQIPNVGDYFLRSVPGFGMSLIIVRGKDGVVRGFQNACRHRGNQICTKQQGNAKSLLCRFHNWNFDLQGNLVWIPDSENFFNIDKADLGLVAVATDIWNGFIFFNLADPPEQSLEAYLGGIGRDLTGYPFNEGTTRFQVTCGLRANWKSVIDSFSETYHVPALHKHSIADTLAGGGNTFGHLIDAVSYGPHRTASVWGNKKYQPKPIQKIAYGYAALSGAAVTSGQGSVDATALPPGVNPARSENWAIDVNVIFPNLVIVIGAGSYFCHQMWPTGPNETMWEMTGFWRPAETAAQRVIQEYFMAELRDAVIEDLNTLERVQSNIDNGVIKEFHYHDHEVALRHHHAAVTNYVAEFEGRRSATTVKEPSSRELVV